MTAAEIALALRGRRGSSGWTARCPAHDDRNPSLSIREASNGKILVRCHAGCGQAHVINALRDRGLWPSNDRHQENVVCTQSGLSAQSRPAERTAAALKI